MDKIKINRLRLFGYHGVHTEERRLGQYFLISLELSADLTPAAQTDDIALAVDYAKVIESVTKLFGQQPVALLETIAQRIADHLLDSYPMLRSVQVEVAKETPPVPAQVAQIAVSITRQRTARA